MRNDARPVGEEFRDIAEHQPANQAHDREPAAHEREDKARESVSPTRTRPDEPPPDASER